MTELPASRIASLETGTGIDWPTWLEFLEPHKELDHTAMAVKVLEKIRADGDSTSPEWWAQGVTVAYEQHIGRRGIGERCDGTFSAGVSKTLPGTMDKVLERLVKATETMTEFAGVPAESTPTTSATDKWRYWRVKLADGSRVTINIQTKPSGDKSTAAVNHDDLDSNERTREIKAWWREFLTGL